MAAVRQPGLKEPEFWTHLELRLCDEMAGNDLCSREGLWCDGFAPSQYRLDEDPPRIEGMAWIGSGTRHQEEWRFTLLLPRPYGDVTEVDWAELLPAEEMTDWLAVDLKGKRFEMRPAGAVPDAEHEALSLKRLKHAVQRLALGATAQEAQFPDFAIAPDELALDFDNWRQVCQSSRYIRGGALAEHLRLLDTHLATMGGEESAGLWTVEALRGAPEWEEARRLARGVLTAAGWPHTAPPRPEQEGDRFAPSHE